MRYRNSIFLVLFLFIVSCNKADKLDPSRADYVTNDQTNPPTELDTWLYNSFTLPYNIQVKYRWDASETPISKILVPPAPTKVLPVMDVVKKVWIDPYVSIAGENFIKKYCPKQFVLTGSASYNPDGTFTLGTAEGGRKIVLYVVNDFVKTDHYSVTEMIHTIEHEFAHILHQNISYPGEFKELTTGLYTPNWGFVSLSQARAQGFITSYAMLSPDEDFVEMISMMLVEGKKGYESILDCQTTAASKQILRKKEELVVRYFREAYNIDFYQLQTKVQEAIQAIAPPENEGEELPPVFDIWGLDKQNKAIRFDLTTMNEPASFVSRYTYDNARLHAVGLNLDYSFKLVYIGEEEVALKLYYSKPDSEPREYFEATFYFFVTKKPNSTVTLEFYNSDENGAYLNEQLGAYAILGFFANQTFTINWLPSCGTTQYVGFYPVNSPANYSFGVPGN
ncbi:putative zinc-binding metallopeptidase [Xanthocytophaga agilis]|uniref:Zinc-binding metallopeptidase n=1 Tax=Xanthocytophaga agilis TaxID=3048010 RepID=A0AAE3QZZ2_9BACT|nr:putative zinc-binding metallopeptidase [Xanthocytophaga agilis]MDJ1501179.1 putative zinc-binding metallopeptidase [Xanthocytophaga agilis]